MQWSYVNLTTYTRCRYTVGLRRVIRVIRVRLAFLGLAAALYGCGTPLEPSYSGLDDGDGQVIVELEISGQNVPVAVDTGSSMLVLKGERAERWGAPVVYSPNNVAIGGRASRQRTTYFKDVRLGPTGWKKLNSLLLYRWQRPGETVGVLGLVGLDLKRVYFDFENQELSWER